MLASNVTAAKPKIGGAIYVAPVGTTLPTDATSVLDNAFKEVGFASDAGIVNTPSITTNAIKVWGGATVLEPVTEKVDDWKFTLVEAKNVETLKLIYGADNVTGTLDTGIVIKQNATSDYEKHAIVVDMILDNAVKRVVLPEAKLKALGEIKYTDSDAVGYESTFGCAPDASGYSHYEYIKKAE